MKGISYDKILLELYKIVNDKFVVDFKEIINDINNISHVENINQHIKKQELRGKLNSRSLNYNNFNEANEGHMILKIKFFKFLNNNDLSKTQRQIEVIRTFSYIDIKDDEDDNYMAISTGNKNVQSIFFFKKMIQSITNYDLDKFAEISSNLTDILRDIFNMPNLYSFIFGLINEYKDDLDKSLRTLNLLDICKNIDHDKFYTKLYQMNLSISRIENKALKQDFQILNLIFGEMVYFLEKTFKKLDTYFIEVKDIELKEKFFYLKQWLIKNGYNFQNNYKFCIVLENTLGYIKNRAQWMQLMKAKNMILNLTSGLKNMQKNYSINIGNANNNKLNSKYKFVKNNEIYYFDNNNKTYNKIEYNNNKIISEDSDQKNNNNKINTNNNKGKQIQTKNVKQQNSQKVNQIKDKSSTFGFSDLSCFDTKKQRNNPLFNMNSRSIGEFPTGAKSIEASFTQKLLKGLQGNFRHLFTDIYTRFTKEDDQGCFICRNDNPVLKNYKLNCQKWVNEYKSLSQLETGINMDKISMIYDGNNKNKNNNSSYYDKDEEIKIHFLDEDKSIKMKNDIKKIKTRNINTNNEIKNNKTFSYINLNKKNK